MPFTVLFLSFGLPLALAAEDEVGLFQKTTNVKRREGCSGDDEVGLLQKSASIDRREDVHEDPFWPDAGVWDMILSLQPLAPTVREDGLPPAICKDQEKAAYLSFGTDPRLFPKAGCPALSDEVLTTPFSQLKMEPGQNPTCLLFPACARALEDNNLAVYTRGYGGPWCGTAGPHETPIEFDNGVIRAPAGNHIADGEYCLLNGWLDLPNAKDLHKNRSAIDLVAQEACNALPQDQIKSWTLSKVFRNWDIALKKALQEAKNPPGKQNPLFDDELLKGFNAGYCASNTMSCVVNFCTDWFCKLPDGRVGSGCQCKDDFVIGFED